MTRCKPFANGSHGYLRGLDHSFSLNQSKENQ